MNAAQFVALTAALEAATQAAQALNTALVQLESGADEPAFSGREAADYTFGIACRDNPDWPTKEDVVRSLSTLDDAFGTGAGHAWLQRHGVGSVAKLPPRTYPEFIHRAKLLLELKRDPRDALLWQLVWPDTGELIESCDLEAVSRMLSEGAIFAQDDTI